MQLRTFTTLVAFGWGIALGWFVTDLARDLVDDNKAATQLGALQAAIDVERRRADNLQATLNVINVDSVNKLTDVAAKFDDLIGNMKHEANKPVNRCRPSPELDRLYRSQFASPNAATDTGPN